MPSTLPDISLATATYKRLTVRLIDKTGDKRAITQRIAIGATLANIQAYLVELASLTNANIYEVFVQDVWATNPSVGDAFNATRASLFQNVATYWRVGATLETQDSYIPAPVEALFEAGTDNVDTGAGAEHADYLVALQAIMPVGYAPVSVRYSERKEVNTKKSL